MVFRPRALSYERIEIEVLYTLTEILWKPDLIGTLMSRVSLVSLSL
jgi:hypothetical protein